MKVEKELGSYSRWIVNERISFRTNTTSAPDQLRDGKSGLLLSVTRVSAGLYTVALRTDRPSIKTHITVQGHLGVAANTAPTQAVSGVHFVDGSWNQTAGTFQVLVLDCNNTTPAAADPDLHTRVYLNLTGSISGVGTDAA